MRTPSPQRFPLVLLLLLLPLAAASPPAAAAEPATAQDPPALSWFDARELAVEGRAWPEAELAAPWDRLPARAEPLVRPPVWQLSRDSAGIAVRFATAATEIHARWRLRSAELAMPHMAATGVSGLDLYARDEAGAWRWVATGQPRAQENQARLIAGLAPVEGSGPREFLLYLPLYNGIESVEIGLPADSLLATGEPRPEDRRLPLLFYGTSITQGACASRPGMAHPAILGRRFDRPVVNLGFSGNGRLELELAELLAEVDAAVYVIDCLPNLNAERVTQRAAPFVRALRAKRPDTPILLVEDRSNTNAWILPARARHHATNRAALRAAYEELLVEGVKGLHYLRGEALLGADAEAAVDGSHPTDLGFARQAEVFAAALGPILD